MLQVWGVWPRSVRTPFIPSVPLQVCSGNAILADRANWILLTWRASTEQEYSSPVFIAVENYKKLLLSHSSSSKSFIYLLCISQDRVHGYWCSEFYLLLLGSGRKNESSVNREEVDIRRAAPRRPCNGWPHCPWGHHGARACPGGGCSVSSSHDPTPCVLPLCLEGLSLASQLKRPSLERLVQETGW